jgi:polyhydroxyalkanoate synthase
MAPPSNPASNQDRLRLGPRPLPQHLSLATATWLNSAAILPALKLASVNWAPSGAASPIPQEPKQPQTAGPGSSNPSANPARENLHQRWAALFQETEKADPAALAAALQAEGLKRFDQFLTGIERYRHYPRRRTVPETPVLWSQGTTRLRDYRLGSTGARDAKAPRLLVIPSLVNRYYILDLEADASFLRWCAAQGMAPFVIDWGAPGDAERGFDFADYVLRLERALEAVAKEPGGPILAIGYCMGGNLALALALRRQALLAGLILLATPWDFHAENKDHALMLAEIGRGLEPVMQLFGELPVDLLQVFFSGFDPFQILRKFQGFGTLDPAAANAQKFVALEDWLNDGTAVAAPIARECLTGWYGENKTAKNQWLVGGEPVDPSKFMKPALSLIPAGDRIVPPKSSLALADALPQSDRLLPTAGHIGMMAGRGALPLVWEPLAKWVRERSA